MSEVTIIKRPFYKYYLKLNCTPNQVPHHLQGRKDYFKEFLRQYKEGKLVVYLGNKKLKIKKYESLKDIEG